MKIYGHLTCHNEFPDVLRAIESIAPICDEVLVTYSGEPKTPLREFLEERKDIYKLKIFDRAFTSLRDQRQFLLEQTPLFTWVISIDADEKYSQQVTNQLREALHTMGQKHYDTSMHDNVPLVYSIPHYNLIEDIWHYDGDPIYHSQKIFYYRPGLHWDFDEYFTHITYKPGPLSFERGDDTTVYSLVGPKDWILIHYARLNPKRKEWRKQHYGDPRFGNYNNESWTDLRNGQPIKPVLLPEEKR